MTKERSLTVHDVGVTIDKYNVYAFVYGCTSEKNVMRTIFASKRIN